MVTDKDGFYTMKGYERSASDEMTSSMEDYLEMVCRMEEEGEPIRVSSLAASLHVRPSSASKMLDNLRKAGYIDFKTPFLICNLLITLNFTRLKHFRCK